MAERKPLPPMQTISTMEAQVQRLAEKAYRKFKSLDGSQRYIIALSGIPGSGKTTFASSVASAVNDLHQREWHQLHPRAADYHPISSSPPTGTSPTQRHRHASDPASPNICQVIPLDGFHFTRAHLSSLPNADEAHYRRGAAFTFDAAAYLRLLETLRKPLEATSRTVLAPSFDHAIKDPVDNDIPIPPTSKVLIVEGLYVALDRADTPWAEAARMVDEVWVMHVEIAEATQRVAKRNFAAGLSPSLEEAVRRTEANDMRNGREVVEELFREGVTERIESVEDEEWKSEGLRRVEEEEGLEARSEQKDNCERERLRVTRVDSIAEMAEAGAGM